MLFNTLAYAKFFAVVFLVVWLLVRRTAVVWLPWIALASVTLLHARGLVAPTACADHPDALPSAGVCLGTYPLLVCALLGALTYFLWRGQKGHEEPRLELVFCSSIANLLGLAWLAHAFWQQPLLTLTLQSIGVRELSFTWWSDVAAQTLVALALASASTIILCTRRIRLLFILGASYVFYAHWDWRFLPLIFGSSTIDYWLGRKIGAATDPVIRRRWLIGTIILNLGVLGVFKYLNFGIDSARQALSQLGYHPPEWTLQVALPVGISFFTFESMSYVIDVYRKDLPPHKSYLEYLSFVAFFPHLVAGPIVRPRDLLPQLGGAPRFSSSEASEGMYLIAWGLLKKVAIGDYLALNLVDRVFDAPTMYSSLEVYIAVVAYAVQIYCDFSGYTDIAIGSALLLGVRFPLNFDAPYKAHSIQDFWRRWHISLSTWLRDYLYVPLGGNRKGSVRTYVNLFLTMLLGGLWHGANWTFVVWGALHGLALAVHRGVTRGVASYRHEQARAPSLSGRLVGVFVTFHFVCGTWIFFRSPSFGSAQVIFSQLGELTTFTTNLHAEVLTVLAIGLLTHWAPERLYRQCRDAFIALPAPAQGLALGGAALVLREMVSAEAVPFVYFQF